MSVAATPSRALLDGVRVLDLAGPAAAYTGRMLADFGADVIVVEDPEDTMPWRARSPAGMLPSGEPISAAFAAGAAGKRSLALRLHTEAGQELFRRAADRVDVVIATAAVGELEALGIGHETLRSHNPRLIFTSVTPFGLTGPHRRWRGSDLIGWAASGALPSIGDADRAPLAPGGGLAHMAAALNAAMGTVMALRARDHTGTGQLVDISVQEAVMSVAMEASPLVLLDTGHRQSRTGRRRPGGPIGHYSTSDGAVSIVGYMPEHWNVLAAWVRDETGIEEITDPVFAGTPVTRLAYAELVDAWVEALTSRYTKQAFFEEAQRRGIPTAPVNTAADVLDDPHLAATGGWQHADGSVPADVRFSTPPVRVDGSALTVGPVPALGADSDAVRTELGLGLAD